MNDAPTHPQIKICGLTRPEDAVFCESMGVDAVGLVFFKKSPRFLEPSQARDIRRSLSERMACVGVFVDEPVDRILSIAEFCGLNAVQLHGRETPEQIERLRGRNLTVIKTLFSNQSPCIGSAGSYPADAFLVECSGGPLPGGNALAWNWADALPLGERYPMILAGGLTSENVGRAIQAASPDAVDASSSLESAPGQKDHPKIERFVKTVKTVYMDNPPRRIFS